MPELIVQETTVYTLAELEALGWNVHAKALEAVRIWANADGDYCQWLTSDMDMWFADQEKGIADVEMAGWDYDRSYANVKGDIELPGFMAAKKLRGKNRAMWHLVEQTGVFDHYYHFDTSKSSNDADIITARWIEEVYQYTDLYDDDRKRYDKIVAQIEVVGKALDAYISELQSRAFGWVKAEIEHRYSDDFAKEEAEAQEMRFTEEGQLFQV